MSQYTQLYLFYMDFVSFKNKKENNDYTYVSQIGEELSMSTV